MAPITPAPLYLDWTFWSFVAAAIAIVLSQCPPVRTWFARGRLEVDVHSAIHVGHKLGYTNSQLLIGLRNVGGREVRIKEISLDLSRTGEVVQSLPARSFFESSAKDAKDVLFLPFSLPPGSERWNTYCFFKKLDKDEERELKQAATSLGADLHGKFVERKANNPADTSYVEGEPENVARAVAIFERRFVLRPVEYALDLRIEAIPPSASMTKRLRFTLFESDCQALRSQLDDYKYGFGVCLDTKREPFVAAELLPR